MSGCAGLNAKRKGRGFRSLSTRHGSTFGRKKRADGESSPERTPRRTMLHITEDSALKADTVVHPFQAGDSKVIPEGNTCTTLMRPAPVCWRITTKAGLRKSAPWRSQQILSATDYFLH